MKGYWGPEFEPSVEEIVDYRLIYIIYGNFLSSLSLVSSHSGGFPYSVKHMAAQVEVTSGSGSCQPAQAARPNIRVYGACAVCR